MKRIIIFLAFMLELPVLLQAQYSGGNGRGDVSLESLNIPVTNKRHDNNTLPAFSVRQNYPNPFNTSTIIKFNVTKLSVVKIVVYDVMGLEVQTLFNGSPKPGMYEATFDGSSEKSGVYFYRIFDGDYSETRRMILEK